MPRKDYRLYTLIHLPYTLFLTEKLKNGFRAHKRWEITEGCVSPHRRPSCFVLNDEANRLESLFSGYQAKGKKASGVLVTEDFAKAWTCVTFARRRSLKLQVGPPPHFDRARHSANILIKPRGMRKINLLWCLRVCTVEGIGALHNVIPTNRGWGEGGPWPFTLSHKCIHAPSPIMRIHLTKSFNSRTCLDWL